LFCIYSQIRWCIETTNRVEFIFLAHKSIEDVSNAVAPMGLKCNKSEDMMQNAAAAHGIELQKK